LRKEEKSDYSAFKVYQIIMLLNCLDKISEKILVTRLSNLAEVSDLLYKDQMSGRKQRSTMNTVLCLTHDIQLANHNKKTLSALLLNIKGAFDHVFLNQLLKIIQDLHLLYILTKWVQLFLSDWTVSLAFDGEKNSDQRIKSGISQGSPISLILFLIYIRFLFTQVKKQHMNSQIKIPSYIDDVAVTVVGNSANENSIVLEKVIKSLFSWAKDNAVVFDDSKTELIHFNKDKETAISTVTLSNNTIIKYSEVVRWLEV